jgi:hypothetical protein
MNAKGAAAKPFVREPAAGATLNVLGVTHTYKAMSAETAAAFSLWEAVVPPGAGAPFEGERAPRRVGPGGVFFGARGKRHAFRNIGEVPARVLILCTPSCGLDRMFGELDAATAAGMPGLSMLMAITAKYGVTIEPPAP